MGKAPIPGRLCNGNRPEGRSFRGHRLYSGSRWPLHGWSPARGVEFAPESQYVLDQPIDVGATGPEIDDADAKAVTPIQRRRRQRDLAGRQQPRLDGRVDPVE